MPILGRPSVDRPAASYCCYGCLRVGESRHSRAGGPLDGMTIRLGIGVLIAGQSMIFGLAINVEESTSHAVKFGVQSLILVSTLLVIALLGGPLLRSAITEMGRGRLTIEALFLLTMSGAMFASLQSFSTGNGPIYFEVISILLVVYSLGKIIGARNREAALASARAWSQRLQTCRLADQRTVDVTTIVPGNMVEVRAGETIAIDGVIAEGIGFVSESAVTGEPFSVVKRPGDRVFAGSISQDALLLIEATASGTARQVDRLMEAVEAARNRPTSMQAQADRLSRIFLPIIVVVATATFVVWTHLAGWQTGLFNAMSVLLVACPCALGLATPIVLWSALNRMAERGLIVHSGDVIERLAGVDRVVFDKTGTLTEESFAIVDIATLAVANERDRILGWLALVESRSDHPVARPFAALARYGMEDKAPRIVAHRTIPGCGVEASIDDHGAAHRLRVGRPDWLGSSNTSAAEELRNRLHARHGQRIAFEIDGELAGVAVVAERLRDSIGDTVAALRGMGLPISVMTGDAPERAVALGFSDVEGQLLPVDKKARIAQTGKPLMIGDGINDASALAAAHVGIALASGTDLANSAASATLHHGDLRTIPWAIALSRDAMRSVRRNLGRAVLYNLIGIALAAFGLLHPIAAALLMMLSSLFVAWSSVRLNATCRHAKGDPGADTNVPPAKPAKRRISRLEMAQAAVHALAFAGQAFCLSLLLHLSPTTLSVLFVAFAFVGIVASYVWLRLSNLPHWLDMSIGMVTLGNLGMLVGWWIDNGFVRLHDSSCFACVEAMRAGQFKPWMLLGMLAGSNIAMLTLGRRSARKTTACRTAMFTGGNLGMILGMAAGGWAASGVETSLVTSAFFLSVQGMTVGMIAGMIIGAAVTQWTIAAWSRSFGNPTAEQPIPLTGDRDDFPLASIRSVGIIRE